MRYSATECFPTIRIHGRRNVRSVRRRNECRKTKGDVDCRGRIMDRPGRMDRRGRMTWIVEEEWIVKEEWIVGEERRGSSRKNGSSGKNDVDRREGGRRQGQSVGETGEAELQHPARNRSWNLIHIILASGETPSQPPPPRQGVIVINPPRIVFS